MIDLNTKKEKLKYQQEFNKQSEVLELSYARKLKAILNKQFDIASYFIENSMEKDIGFAVDKLKNNQIELLTNHYKKVATVFGKKAFKSLGQNFKYIIPTNIKEPIDNYWSEFNLWLVEEAARKITKIQTTTKNIIAKIISQGMRDGKSTAEIAKLIKKTSKTINSYRALTIALTETHTAAVRATNSAVKSTGLKVEREWMSAKDKRTRTREQGSEFEHYRTFPNGADGEKVGMDEPFVGTGEKLDYPGDSKGSAGNIVRCRCVVLFNTIK